MDKKESVMTEKVNLGNGVVLSTSLKTGGVRVDVLGENGRGSGQRAGFYYQDELEAILDKADQIRAYIDANPTRTKLEVQNERKIAEQSLKARAKAVAALIDTGLYTKVQAEEMVEARSQKVAG